MKQLLIILVYLWVSFTKIVDIASDFPLSFGGTSGWSGGSNGSVQSCSFGNIFGPFGQSSGVNIGKSFSNLPPHYSLTVSIVLYPLWSWDHEHLVALIDGTEYFRKSIYFGTDLFMENRCPNPKNDAFFLLTTAPIPLSFNITHSSSSVQVNFKAETNDVWQDEALGLSLFYLSVDTCHYTCATCNGPSENQCLTCPSGSTKYDGSFCQCNTGTTAINNSCQASCSFAYTPDTIKNRCIENCPIKNCQTCANQLCIGCYSGYKLIKGKCTDRCPWYTNESGGQCLDPDFDNTPKPYILAEDMIASKFNHAYVQSKGWQYKKYQTYNSKSYSNLVANQCNNLSLVGGFNFLLSNDTCSSGCGLQNTYSDLPKHYKATLKYQIWCGDTWDAEFYYASIDGTEIQRDQFRVGAASRVFVCGQNRDNMNNANGIRNVQKTVQHTSSSLSIEIGYILNSSQWDEWGAHREIQLFLHLCENDLCSSCADQGQNCTGCKGSSGQESSRLVNNQCICPIKYYDIYPDQNECQQCNDYCADCIQQSDNCTECIEGDHRNPKPNCKCIDGYYQEKDLICYKCDYFCSTCVESSNNCLTCQGSHRNIQLASCACLKGYFDIQVPNCQQCSPQCESCQQNKDQCIVCSRGFQRTMQQPLCGCKEGYYEFNVGVLDCKQCFLGCKKCEQFTGKCLECNNPNFSTLNCQEQSVGNFLTFETITNTDIKIYENVACENQCLTCQDSPSNCTQCKITQNRQNLPPDCPCEKGYHDSNSTTEYCEKCSSKCKQCLSFQQCTQCYEEQNRQLNLQTFECVCKKGYTEQENQNLLCVPCYKYKGRCFQQCPKNTIKDQQQKICIDKIFKNKENKIYLNISFGTAAIVFILIFFIFICLSYRKLQQINKIYNKSSQQGNLDKTLQKQTEEIQEASIQVEQKQKDQQNLDKSQCQTEQLQKNEKIQEKDLYTQQQQNEIIIYDQV